MSGTRLVRTSRLENIMAAQFDILGIPYVRQMKFEHEGFHPVWADFWLHWDIVLEINGTYWHSDPVVYAKKHLTNEQRRTMKSYQRKLELYSQLELQVFELWEEDIRRNPAACAIRVADWGALWR